MCGPAAVPIAMMAISAASAAAQQKATSDAADYNYEVAKDKQTQVEAEATNVQIAGSQEAGRAHIENQKSAANMRATFGAQGISGSTGTPGDVLQDTAEVGALEQMTIVNNAGRQAFGMRTQAQNAVDQAKFQVDTTEDPFKNPLKPNLTILGAGAQGYSAGQGMVR